jgi:hypothetical protein
MYESKVASLSFFRFGLAWQAHDSGSFYLYSVFSYLKYFIFVHNILLANGVCVVFVDAV